VSAPAGPVPGGVVHSTGDWQPELRVQGPPLTVDSFRYTGLAMLVTAAVLVLVAVTAGLIYTAPPPGSCFSACPASELTPNNLFTLITLVVVSASSFILGTVLITIAWFRQHPAS
jgi:hypothetical protein